MESIKIMVAEHENVRRMLKVIRNISYRVLTNGQYDIDDFPRIIDFVRTYTDKLHHGKEEDIFFATMEKELEKLAKSGAIKGMYIEHDSGRLYMANLEKGLAAFREGKDEARLDIIANAICYADLLDRHIEKENTAMYSFAERMLPDEIKSYIDEESRKVDIEATAKGTQEKYEKLLAELEDKYS
ncbi:hemerythrin domain-containing protein [Tissierella creatinini]|nr:hemerythrin domain-containing protein [Tissierella creatinini]TJX67260.1 hemerythrin domain-containing protein [Soehngenia saccharolytica]